MDRQWHCLRLQWKMGQPRIGGQCARNKRTIVHRSALDRVMHSDCITCMAKILFLFLLSRPIPFLIQHTKPYEYESSVARWCQRLRIVIGCSLWSSITAFTLNTMAGAGFYFVIVSFICRQNNTCQCHARDERKNIQEWCVSVEWMARVPLHMCVTPENTTVQPNRSECVIERRALAHALCKRWNKRRTSAHCTLHTSCVEDSILYARSSLECVFFHSSSII